MFIEGFDLKTICLAHLLISYQPWYMPGCINTNWCSFPVTNYLTQAPP